MNWEDILKTLVPAAVGALSAIAAAIVSNHYAALRHRLETQLKDRELQQRLLESLVPHRLTAYKNAFILLQQLKDEQQDRLTVVKAIIPDLFWIEPNLALRIQQMLQANKMQEIPALQARIREVAGAAALEASFGQMYEPSPA